LIAVKKVSKWISQYLSLWYCSVRNSNAIAFSLFCLSRNGPVLKLMKDTYKYTHYSEHVFLPLPCAPASEDSLYENSFVFHVFEEKLKLFFVKIPEEDP
jgi:hypothetical protein